MTPPVRYTAAMAQQSDKTNAIRLLEASGLAFEILHYEVDEDYTAFHAAEKLGLDLKKAAKAAGDKACALLFDDGFYCINMHIYYINT